MATIHVTESITIDGVMQAPGRADEDTRGGFTHGGWAQGFTDRVAMEFLGEGMSQSGGMLFGRRSYHDLLRAWTATTEPNPFTQHLLDARKWVATRTPDVELPYPNSVALVGDAAETVARLRDEVDGSLSIIGSGELVRALHAAGLIDGYTLQIHPLVLGSGTRLFADDAAARADLRLERSVTTSTGVVIAQFAVRR